MIAEKQKSYLQYGKVGILKYLMLEPVSLNTNNQTFAIKNSAGQPLVSFQVNQQGELEYWLSNQLTKQVLTPNGGFIKNTQIGVSNGVCPLNSNVKINQQYMPFNIYFNTSNNIGSQQGVQNDLLITTDTLRLYIYQNSQWVVTGNSSSLSDLQPPISDFNLNNQKITNLQPGTLSTDAVTVGQLDRNHFMHSYIDTNVSNVGTGNVQTTYNVLFTQFIEPSALVPPVISYIQHSIDNSNINFPFSVFTLQQGVYTINIKTLIQYKGSTQYPIQFYLIDLLTGPISYTLIEGDGIDNFNSKKITNNSVVMRVSSVKQIALQFLLVPQYTNLICSGTSMFIQRID